MKLLKFISALIVVFASNGYSQTKNLKIETAKIYGNAGICESAIEKAGSVKKIANVDWNQNTKMATLTFDSLITSKQDILKRIALAGYDNDSFIAPDDTYANLQSACQYERVQKKGFVKNPKMEMVQDHLTDMKTDTIHTEVTVVNQDLKIVFDNYFKVKDALVESDLSAAVKAAKALLNSIEIVKMNELPMDVHMVWMKVLPSIKKDSEVINSSKDLEKQRKAFSTLSESMYQLAKTIKVEYPIYYQHCPMANNGKGANWLSKEKEVKNPYYGAKMLTCGEIIEIIK